MRSDTVAAAALVVALMACSSATDDVAPATSPPETSPSGAPADDGPYVPGETWESEDPERAGVASAGLDQLAALAEEAESNCVVVLKGGRIVGERYWNGTDVDTDQEVFSASKSVTSTLVGLAQEAGDLDIDQPASDFLTEWQGTDSQAVTIRNLLSNDSGRYWDARTDYPTLLNAPDVTAQAMGLGQQAEPGTVWRYNNSAIQTLELVIERATGTDMADYAEEALFSRIGMTSSVRRDPAGNPLAFMGVQAGCRDMARFALLFQRGGEWGGTRVVPAGWVAEATSPSQDLNPSYGFLWWLNGARAVGPLSDATATGGDPEPADGPRVWPGATPGSFAALGFGNQIALVMPERDMVVVRLGRGGRPTSGGRLVADLAALASQADDALPDPA